jgi:phosphoribosylformylglycinamidine synthase
MTAAVLHFLGTNCERDTLYALQKVGAKVQMVAHTETTLPKKCDLVVIPGGFSYGDYLRCGAIAGVAPIMTAVRAFAENGGRVLGICNGFQILLETGLLPGAMRRNANLHFISRHQSMKVCTTQNSFLGKLKEGQILTVPVAHAEGNYYIDEAGYKALQEKNQILLTYCDEAGNAVDVNGAVGQIAGICNAAGNVFGLMPHPERAVDSLTGSTDGLAFLKSVVEG